MTAYTVDPSQAEGLAEIAASLPLSLGPTGDRAPQLVAVEGSSGWEQRAREAADGGALAVVVGSPSLDETAGDDAARLDGDHAARVVLAWDFAANPGVLAAAALLDGTGTHPRERARLAEAVVRVPPGTDLDAALLDALVAVGRVAGEPASVRSLHRSASSWHLAGEARSGAPLALSLLVTNAAPASLRLRILTDDGGLTAVVPSPETAAPAEVRIIGRDGERLLPTLWETSRRASWRRAVAIAAGGTLSADVAELHRIIHLIPARLG
ncbi:hypothetical protein SPF06_09510 [Sinomonas sp. JGH33]|uniref:Uncharacterized protein n=1 Tax=Sinomonas terricola TaxID=3110330 RepID=A0ABU5T756_9MICC|nr:hypothetical protein [Sinomonas sp. JGH33]MEA5454956.1 hypothetical protein [Sinomonas sp. JGH33]